MESNKTTTIYSLYEVYKLKPYIFLSIHHFKKDTFKQNISVFFVHKRCQISVIRYTVYGLGLVRGHFSGGGGGQYTREMDVTREVTPGRLLYRCKKSYPASCPRLSTIPFSCVRYTVLCINFSRGRVCINRM